MKKLSAVLLSMALASNAFASDYAERDDVKAYMATVAKERGMKPAFVKSIIEQAVAKPKIIEAITRPAEGKAWYEYRKIFIQDSRIDKGVIFWNENEAALTRAEKEYGVEAEIIVAIIGVETRYGGYMGSYRVLDALATLSFDYPKRQRFFQEQLSEYLSLIRSEGWDLNEMKGSYAGAMGMPQFMPSSFRHWAVDFDGDGQRDLWANSTDVVGSVGNYFKKHGWVYQQPVLAKVSATQEALDKFKGGVKAKHDVAAILKAGVKYEHAPTKAPTKAVLVAYEQKDGNDYYLAYPNFTAITKYNRSPLYAMATYQLAQEIKARRQQALAKK